MTTVTESEQASCDKADATEGGTLCGKMGGDLPTQNLNKMGYSMDKYDVGGYIVIIYIYIHTYIHTYVI